MKGRNEKSKIKQNEVIINNNLKHVDSIQIIQGRGDGTIIYFDMSIIYFYDLKILYALAFILKNKFIYQS